MVDNARNFCPQVRNQYSDTAINPQDGDRTRVSCLIFRAWWNGGSGGVIRFEEQIKNARLILYQYR